MTLNTNNFIVIGHDVKSGNFWAQERTNENGKPGMVKIFFDGQTKNAKKLISSYAKSGYNIKNIIYNGQPATDLFEKKDTTKLFRIF